MPPTRLIRYCCSELKEAGGAKRYCATGVRWDESTKRASRQEFEKIGSTVATKETYSTVILNNDNDSKRRMTENCIKQSKMMVNPIIDWTHRDVWDFLEQEKVEINPLYKCGYSRVGCIGCPMAGKHRWDEFRDYPKYKEAYIRTFDRLVKTLDSREWKSGQDVFDWWMEDKNIKGQMKLTDIVDWSEE